MAGFPGFPDAGSSVERTATESSANRGIFLATERVSKVRTVPEDFSGESGDAEVPEPEPNRWKRYESRLRERAQAAKAGAEARREDSRLYDTMFRVYERNRILPASELVGALASRIVIYLIPPLGLSRLSQLVFESLANQANVG